MSETKTVYQVDDDGLYAGNIVLNAPQDINPLETKNSGHIVWQIPGGCVEVEPPLVPEGKNLYWRNDEWILEDKPPEPEPQPEPEPTTEDKLNALDATYSFQFSELVNALGLANLDNDTTLVAELQNEYYVLKAQYQQEREDILNE